MVVLPQKKRMMQRIVVDTKVYFILFEMNIRQMDVQSILENMLIRIQNDEVYKFLSKIIFE